MSYFVWEFWLVSKYKDMLCNIRLTLFAYLTYLGFLLDIACWTSWSWLSSQKLRGGWTKEFSAWQVYRSWEWAVPKLTTVVVTISHSFCRNIFPSSILQTHRSRSGFSLPGLRERMHPPSWVTDLFWGKITDTVWKFSGCIQTNANSTHFMEKMWPN